MAILSLVAELEEAGDDFWETRVELDDAREDLGEDRTDLAAQEARIDELVADNATLRGNETIPGPTHGPGGTSRHR